VPRKLAEVLVAKGVQARTAESQGWKDLTNGDLVEAAVRAGFSCVLTRDRLFSESAARSLRRFPEFCVVLITVPQLRGHEFLDTFQTEWDRRPILPVHGAVVRWPGP